MSNFIEHVKSSRPRTAIKAPTPKTPLIDTSQSSPGVAAMGDIINNVAAPFQEGPDPNRGTLGKIEHGIGAVMGIVGAPFELMDTGFALVTAPLAALMPGFPAATLLAPHLGSLHGHAHPPSLIPPAVVPIPLPSIGTVMCAGAVSVLVGGIPAARAGDVGLAVTCGSLSPAFEIYTGSSNTFIGGSRAARMGTDITRHCNPASALGKLGAAMGAIGVVAGAIGAGASATAGDSMQAAMQAAQAAADAVALAMSALLGKDPGLPPALGVLLVGNPTVLIGGFPLPDLLDVLGAALKGLKKIGNAVSKSPTFKKLIAKVGLCNDKGEPVSSFTGAVYNDFDDYRASSGFSWERHYKSSWNLDDGPLGYGFRHFFDRRLELLRTRAVYETHDGERVAFPRDEKGRYIGGEGYTFEHLASGRYLLRTDRDEELEFLTQPTSPPSGRLLRYKRAALELLLSYDDQGRLRTITEPRGTFPIDTRLVYDASDRIIEVHRGPREATPQIISRYAYENGCLVAWQDALGATAHMRYDEVRRMVQGTDRRGYSFHWNYDPGSGRCIKSHGDDGLWGIEARYEGDRSIFKEPDGGEWTFKHFPDGIVSHIIDPLDGVLEYVRDKETGKIVRQILPGGTEFRWLYDRKGKHYARADQWAHQFRPEDLDPDPRDPLAHDGPLTHKAWLWGRPLEQLLEPLAGLPAIISHVLERLGPYTLESPQPAPEPVRDASGHIVEQTERDGKVRRFRRDGEGNMVAEEDVHGNWSQREMTSWNLVGAETSALGNTTRYTYTHQEKWRSLVDPNGNTTEYVRDPLHRVRELYRHGGLYRRYAYDAHDTVVAEQDGAGNTLASYAVAPNGLHASCALASGELYIYEYDTHGRPTLASSVDHEIELAHLRNLRRRDERDGKGVEHSYESWLSVLRTRYFDRFVVQYRYQGAPGVRIRTPDGKEHRIWRTSRGLVVRENANRTSEATVFDQEQRLCARVCWNKDRALQGPTWMQRFNYSAHGELLSWSDSERGLINFDYDADHRLIAQTDQRGRRAYDYDHAGNLSRTPERRLIEYKPGNLIDHADFDHFEHDECHRVSKVLRFQRPEVTYRYDSKGQLVEARFSDRPDVWRATYDGLGRRLWKEYAGARTDFYWDGDRLAAERSPDGKLRLYIYVNEDAIVPFMWLDYASEDAEPASGKAYYIFAAPSGMPLRVEDADRDVVWQLQSIDAYGKIEIAPRAKVDLRLRFAGHFYDEHLDLFYNRFRDYDPSLGRYLQPDPIGHDGGINLYAYPPNPLVDVDLRGLVHRKGPAGEGPAQTQALKDAVKEDGEATKAGKTPTQLKKHVMTAGVRNKKTGDIFTATNKDARTALRDGTLHPVMKKRVKAVDDCISTHERLQREGKSSKEIADMSDEDLRRELAKDGVAPTVEGMDTTEQLRRTNERVQWREDQAAKHGKPSDQKAAHDSVRAENGNHGEVKATSDALDQIEADRGPPPPKATAEDIKDLELHNQRFPDDAADPLPDEAYPRCHNCQGLTEGVEPTPELRAAEQAMKTGG